MIESKQRDLPGSERDDNGTVSGISDRNADKLRRGNMDNLWCDCDTFRSLRKSTLDPSINLHLPCYSKSARDIQRGPE